MKRNLKSLSGKIYKTMLYYGFDPKKLWRALWYQKSKQWFYSDLKKLKQQMGEDKTFAMGPLYPVLTDKKDEGGTMKGAYFHQDLYVAQLIHEANPQKHLDIGSRADGFVAHVASFREIELIDIREIHSKVKNVVFRQADLMQLPPDLVDYCDSVSSLHVIEHFGLGRYGDPIDFFGYLKAIDNIAKILKKDGTFYFSVPIGPQRIEFNAHRVFNVDYLVSILCKDFEISSFSYIDDKGDFHENADWTGIDSKYSFGCQFGCGVFVLRKL
jgi:SAM-dependent methyltransferase